MDKFKANDFSYEFDTEFVDSYDKPLPEEPRGGVPLNAYKQFKAIHGKETYYMSGVHRRGY